MENAAAGSIEQAEAENERLKRLNQIYLLIISRYKDYIEEKEEVAVAELPRLVMPNSQLVEKKAKEIQDSIPNYFYEANFKEASIAAFTFVQKGIDEIMLPVQFWLTPEEAMSFSCGDGMDRNILLCSLFIALGNPSARVLVVMNMAGKVIRVYYDYNGTFTIFDLASGSIGEFGGKDEMLRQFSINENTTAYEFNDQVYIDIE